MCKELANNPFYTVGLSTINNGVHMQCKSTERHDAKQHPPHYELRPQRGVEAAIMHYRIELDSACP